eukprot:1608970-Amphidinium_carterae.1
MSSDAISLATSSAARSPGAVVLPASSSVTSGSCALLAPLAPPPELSAAPSELLAAAPPELAVVSAKRTTL